MDWKWRTKWAWEWFVGDFGESPHQTFAIVGTLIGAVWGATNAGVGGALAGALVGVVVGVIGGVLILSACVAGRHVLTALLMSARERRIRRWAEECDVKVDWHWRDKHWEAFDRRGRRITHYESLTELEAFLATLSPTSE